MQFLFKKRPKKLEERLTEMFRDAPVFETKRLILTKICAEHAEDMYKYSCDPDVTKYLTWSPHSSRKETENYIKLLAKKYDCGAFHDFGLVLKESGRMIGTCGFTSADDSTNTLELGYVLAKDMWGQGLATEAASFLAAFSFEILGADRVIAKMLEGNKASYGVMKKLGMTLEGVYRNAIYIKGEYKTVHVCGVDRRDFPTEYIDAFYETFKYEGREF